MKNELGDYIGDTRVRCVMEGKYGDLWISTYTNDLGLYIKCITTIKDGTKDIYIALTGDQCAITDTHQMTGGQDMFKVYEMRRGTDDIPASAISPVPLDAGRIAEYKRSYNAAFRPMREALGIAPFDWYTDDGELPDKAEDIYVLTDGEELIGSVACYGNEIDDLFVSETHLRRGYGRELLLWAMDCIRSRGYDEIVLHVAAWNEGAVRMYRREGFVITKSEIILKEQDDMIHRIDRSDIPECVRVIRDSFMTVAEDLGLTPENAPRSTAFATTEDRLYHQLDAEDRYMAAYYLDDGSIAGYYSLLMQEDGICELNNLCVLPEH
ncbi:MAG: GNAT family N-acetyltransferase, partial [Oscillospiraceae bacterium]|nr:GNAT family N-acetyltransferase [Oscillospiraceae bacterium]